VLNLKTQYVVVTIALMFVLSSLGIFVGTWQYSSQHYAGQAAAAHSALSARDQKILAVIVKKNPQASIRDFADFPAKLVAEAERHGMDPRFLMAVIEHESEWNPRAVSPAGAIGLMQVMPATARLVVDKAKLEGYEPPSKGSLGSLGDPGWSVRIGTQYLRWKMDEYGFGPDHLRAYNAGVRPERAAPRYAEDIALKFVRLSMQVPL
jgi:soluble lytic murein transglycosylase-like protein